MENHPDDHAEAISARKFAAQCVEIFTEHQQGSSAFDSLVACAAGVLQRFKYNNFSVVDDLYMSIAAGVFPVGAILNHSCRPNCVLHYFFDEQTGQVRQVVRLIADNVSPGDELFHSYCDSCLPRSKRQPDLKTNYHFTCDCELCTSEDPSVLELDRALEMRFQVEDNLTAFSVFHAADPTLRKQPQFLTVAGQALTCALEIGQFKVAKEACQALIDIYSVVFPGGFHPLVGLQYFTLKDLLELEINEGGHDPTRIKQRNEAAKRAAQILSVTFAQGKQAPLYKALESQLTKYY